MSEELALIEPEELSLVENNSLNPHQLQHILKKTPAKYIKERPAKGGGTWKYVTGGYIKKCLNLMFGWDWDFDIVEHGREQDQIWVKGKLTCRSNGRTITKMQFGHKDIAFKTESYKDDSGQTKKRPTDKFLDYGNDLKAAATDCLKKCASEIGIASDIYNANDFREINVAVDNEITQFDLIELFEAKKEALTPMEITNAERIINGNEINSFSKLHSFLKSK